MHCCSRWATVHVSTFCRQWLRCCTCLLQVALLYLFIKGEQLLWQLHSLPGHATSASSFP